MRATSDNPIITNLALSLNYSVIVGKAFYGTGDRVDNHSKLHMAPRLSAAFLRLSTTF